MQAMVAFGIAYRLARDTQTLVIPALLEPTQPEHDFKAVGALAFQLDFNAVENAPDHARAYIRGKGAASARYAGGSRRGRTIRRRSGLDAPQHYPHGAEEKNGHAAGTGRLPV